LLDFLTKYVNEKSVVLECLSCCVCYYYYYWIISSYCSRYSEPFSFLFKTLQYLQLLYAY
jgi:hypothetical protein